MNKSDFLDELRLEVGLVRDEVKTMSDFYVGITKKIATRMGERLSINIYETTDTMFVLKESSGPLSVPKEIAFGDGLLSLVAIRGSLVYRLEERIQKVFVPFYQKHHLLGVIEISVYLDMYELSEDDLVFFEELGRFIEVQHEIFHSIS